MFNIFDRDFYPTPTHVLDIMLDSEPLEGKVVLEPSAGKGNIVDYLQARGAEVLACEKESYLLKIVAQKCTTIGDDFLKVESHQVSHIHYIVMNPPFSRGAEHILHAYHIAPPGCKIIALCNAATLKNDGYSSHRLQLKEIVGSYGQWRSLGDCFSEDAERKTEVEVALVQLQKPGANYDSEFEGFFLEDDPEEAQGYGVMSYNVVRDLVNRYVGAVKLFDEQLDVGVRMNALTRSFTNLNVAFQCTEEGKPKLRNDYKKELQKAGWMHIFSMMNMGKHATRGLKEDINKFVEQQTHIPFSMRNIYRMLEIVIGTAGQRMDKALEEVFDKLTEHHAENRFHVKGWKTNSHYLVNRRFIMPDMTYQDQRWYKGESRIQTGSGRNWETMEDFVKALCYITGHNYDEIQSLTNRIGYPVLIRNAHTKQLKRSEYGGLVSYRDLDDYNRGLWAYKKEGEFEAVHQGDAEYGAWFDWPPFFRCKAHKNGTVHFEFLDEDVWGRFNQRVSKIKGYPLYEPKKQTAYQERQTGRAQQEKGTTREAQIKVEQANIFSFEEEDAA